MQAMQVRQTDTELTFTRTFKASPELLWKALTEPERLSQWWGPNGWTVPVCDIDLRPDGIWRYCLEGSRGERHWVKAIYREIVEPERLVYLNMFADEQGRQLKNMPEPSVVTMTLTKRGDGTELTSRTRYATPKDLEAVMAMGKVAGTTESWDKLTLQLEGKSDD